MSIKVVTDSTISISPNLIKELEITIVPLSFMIDGVIYTDGEMSLLEYLDRSENSSKLPKTSQPPVGVFDALYNELSEDGSSIISIHLSQTLSGTVEAARQGAMISGKDVTVIDSTFTDQGLAFQVVEAARLAKLGATKEEVLEAINHIQENTELYCGVATLDNLIKGGRIGRVTGLIGGLLDMHLVLQMKDSNLLPFKKGRGSKTFKKFIEELSNNLAESTRKIKEIGISHAEALPLAQSICAALQKFVEKPITILETNTVIATHTGRGAFAVMINYE
ncbi:DegV family protein [Lactovum miscens]|uniref:DegV family protein with EDD domain n=1 Tax=Lactovum miscens TaxID=190387 RepID=A0A841C3U4_9LACT|nr:DegV family protein [Lactovum miscens]MBB5887493.1 DegV family protein with EDD domain [Lactovum miscens]